MSIIACDPGGTHTGLVWIDYDETVPPQVTASWTLPGSIEAFADWWVNRRPVSIDTVVCEQFVSRNIRGVDLSPLRLQGAIEVLCHISDVPIVLQPASGSHTAITDDAMKRAGFVKGEWSQDHHADRWAALRHGLWYLKRMKHKPTLELLYPR